MSARASVSGDWNYQSRYSPTYLSKISAGMRFFRRGRGESFESSLRSAYFSKDSRAPNVKARRISALERAQYCACRAKPGKSDSCRALTSTSSSTGRISGLRRKLNSQSAKKPVNSELHSNYVCANPEDFLILNRINRNSINRNRSVI